MRRSTLGLPALILVLAGSLALAVWIAMRIVDTGKERPPSVVLLVLDTVRPDRLSVYGAPRDTTPNLSRIAQEGIRFDRAYSPSPWTLPAHASLFTGLLPTEHGCHWEHRYLVDAHETLAERLLDRGYRTSGITSNVNASRFYNLDQGFESFVEIWRERSRYPDFSDSEIVCKEAASWLDSIDDDEPFFLFVNMMDPHLPYWPKDREDRELFFSQDRGAPRAAGYGDLLDRVLLSTITVDDDVRRELEDLYDAELRYLDRMVSRLWEELVSRGHDECLLVITSDHGEALGEGGLVEHQLSISDRLLHVPLIMRWPGSLPGGGVIDEMVATQDLYEAILNVASGGKEPVRDLAPEDGVSKPLLSEYFAPLEIEARLEGRVDDQWFVRRRALRVEENGRVLKYVRRSDHVDFLYDVGADPEESSPLENEPLIEAIRLRFDDVMGPLRPLYGQESPQDLPLDEVGLKILESLGYVSSDKPARAADHAAECSYVGFLLLARGEHESAARNFRMACSLKEEAVDPRFGLARALDLSGHVGAPMAYRKYLELAEGRSEESPRCQLVRSRLAELEPK